MSNSSSNCHAQPTRMNPMIANISAAIAETSTGKNSPTKSNAMHMNAVMCRILARPKLIAV